MGGAEREMDMMCRRRSLSAFSGATDERTDFNRDLESCHLFKNLRSASVTDDVNSRKVDLVFRQSDETSTHCYVYLSHRYHSPPI